MTVAGAQSDQDCAAIKKFQERYGISPAAGMAGPLTLKLAQRVAAVNPKLCEATATGTTACVDLTNQMMWVVRDGAVVYGPAVVRTGMGGGYQTPAGKFKIQFKKYKEWSQPYKVWLYNWQYIVDGMGFHTTTTYIHDSFGSHGCVNLLPSDADKVFELTQTGDAVNIFGRRPNT